MPVTKDQAHMLAALAIAARPYGAPTWDAPGVVAAIGKVSNLLLADVALAVIRAATDATAKTPAVIANTSSQHWREKTQQTAPRPGPVPHLAPGDPPPTEWAQARAARRDDATRGTQ